MNDLGSLVCGLIGHDYSIKGITGQYKWCRRCRDRVNIGEPQMALQDVSPAIRDLQKRVEALEQAIKTPPLASRK